MPHSISVSSAFVTYLPLSRRFVRIDISNCCFSSMADRRAPYLFAAVLQQAGAGQQLLPLLADPARAAFQGLSITARHNRAFHIYPFIQVETFIKPAAQFVMSFQ